MKFIRVDSGKKYPTVGVGSYFIKAPTELAIQLFICDAKC
jgi:hypothetical protein